MPTSEPASIYLKEPDDKVEYVSHILYKAYRHDITSWYDLAKVAIAAVHAYEERYE